MGLAFETEGRSATVVAAMPDSTSGDSATSAASSGTIETCEERERRLRSNSEETALILTSMMSMGAFNANTQQPHTNISDDDDMGEDMSGDENDDGENRSQHGTEPGARLRNESNRVKSLVTKHISIDELREHFDRPIIDVAKEFGICITLMKKICRRNGIKRWPHRQIRSLSKSIASMEAAMLSSQGPEREKYRDQIANLKLKRDAVIADPNKENSMMGRPKTPTKDTSSLRPHAHVHAAPKLSPRAGAMGPSTSPDVVSRSKADGAQTQSKGGRWTSEEHAAFLHGIRLYGKDWRRVAQVVRTRSAVQTRTHAQKYLLKFAGRFPFDADALDIKEQQDSAGGVEAATPRSSSEEQAADADASEPVAVKKSALEAMTMILSSSQFKSYREFAPPPLETPSTEAKPSEEDAEMSTARP